MVKYSTTDSFTALAHPVRRQMLEQLAGRGNQSLSELAQPFSLSLPAIKKHADVLESHGLVVSKKDGRVRYYAMNMESLIDGLAWFKAMEQTWEGRFDRLEALLKAKK